MKQKKSRTDEVYQKMKTAILYGYPFFMPGDLLSENKLAEHFNVSKTPVREALNRLRYENLVEVIPYKGYFVTSLSYSDLADLFQLRLILETGAVELAIKHMTNEHLNKLKALTDRRLIDKNENLSLQFRKLNLEFHTFLAEISGNKWMAVTIKQIVEQMQRDLFANITEADLDVLFKEHEELVEVLESGDVQQAKKIVEKQIEAAKQRVLK